MMTISYNEYENYLFKNFNSIVRYLNAKFRGFKIILSRYVSIF